MCGERISKHRTSFSCQEHADNIAQTFGILCSGDNPDIHPPFICHGCFSVTKRSKKAAAVSKPYHHSAEVFSWSSHSPDECAICDHFEKISTGGRPKKRSRKPGRPAIISNTSAIDHTHFIAPPSFFPTNAKPARELSIKLESASVVTAELVCKMCAQILDQPIQLTNCRGVATAQASQAMA